MLKKLRLLFNGNLETDSQAKKRIKRKQLELALKLKQQEVYQKQMFRRPDDQLELN